MTSDETSDRPPNGGGPGGALPGGGGADATGDRESSAGPRRYADVVWYRRSGIHNVFMLAGFFLFPPLLWFTCVIVLSGPVYLNEYHADGRLKTWGPANKVAAGVLIGVQVVAVVVRFLAS